MTGVLIKRSKETERRTLCEVGHTHQDTGTTAMWGWKQRRELSGHKPRDNWGYRKLEEAWQKSGALRESMALATPSSWASSLPDLWENKLLWFKASSLWWLVTAALELTQWHLAVGMRSWHGCAASEGGPVPTTIFGSLSCQPEASTPRGETPPPAGWARCTKRLPVRINQQLKQHHAGSLFSKPISIYCW